MERIDFPLTVLGVDPGSRKLGWGIVVLHSAQQQLRLDSGVLNLPSKAPFHVRLLQLSEGLEEVIKKYRPDHAAVEGVFSAHNPKSALALGQARGAALLTLARHQLTPFEYSPSLIKQTITSSGRAEKAQVARMVQILLHYPHPMKEDESDALAIALTHASAIKSPLFLKTISL